MSADLDCTLMLIFVVDLILAGPKIDVVRLLYIRCAVNCCKHNKTKRTRLKRGTYGMIYRKTKVRIVYNKIDSLSSSQAV